MTASLSLHYIIGQQKLLVDAPLIDQYEYGRLAVLSQWRVWLVLTKLRLEGKNWKYNHLRRLRGADVADRGHSVYLNDSVAKTIAFLFGFMNESGFKYALLRRDSRPMVAHKTNSDEFFRTKISFTGAAIKFLCTKTRPFCTKPFSIMCLRSVRRRYSW